MPKYTKQHYEALAALLRESKALILKDKLFDAVVVDEVARHISTMFEQDNVRFDPAQFWEAYKDGS